MRNDLISRCKLFNRLATLPAPAEANTFKAEVYKILQEMETEDRPQGKWIFDPEILCSDIGVYSAGYRCSVCGKDYFKVEGMNYCPNCGADMREGE